MLILFRWHKKSCKHKKKGRAYRNCQCPIWLDGTLGGKRVLKSLKMRDWQAAHKKMVTYESEGMLTNSSKKSISDGWADYFVTAVARNLSSETIRKYELLQRQMEMFAQDKGFKFLKELDVEALDKFRSTWKDGPRSSAKKLERMKAFFKFAVSRKWISENPTSDLKPAKITLRPTMPFTRAEMESILNACDEYIEEMPASASENGKRLKTLVLLLRYSGLRIGDAVSLACERLKGNRLFLYTAKSGVPVNLILPPIVLDALEHTSKVSSKYWFWSGDGKVESCSKHWQARFKTLFQIANIPDGHAHRFRDTFAVEHLLAGVKLERVSILLGHQSVRITEKHYAPWAQERQDQLEADQRAAWERDKIASGTIYA